MKKIKSIKKLINLTLIGGSILTTLPLIISSCSSGNNIDTTYYGNIDGSNWKGRTNGNLSYTVNDDTHVVTYVDNNDFTAKDLIFPDVVVDDSTGKKYSNIQIDSSSVFNGSSILSGTLTFSKKCITTLSGYSFASLTNVTGDLVIPNSITAIVANAFRDSIGFNGVLTIADGFASIEAGAFSRCSNLTGNLVIPNSVTNIGSNAFEYCYGFTGSLTIPNNVTVVSSYAFAYCNGFNGNLTISDSVINIGDRAFANCSNFTGTLTIGKGVINIGTDAFINLGCSSIALNGSWANPTFTSWWNGGSPNTNLTLGGKTWNIGNGNIIVSGVPF